MQKKMKKDKMADFANQMYGVLKELQESACYWSEYDVPLGIVDRINDVLNKVENTEVIKTTFDLRLCFEMLKDKNNVVTLNKEQQEEILKQIEK